MAFCIELKINPDKSLFEAFYEDEIIARHEDLSVMYVSVTFLRRKGVLKQKDIVEFVCDGKTISTGFAFVYSHERELQKGDKDIFAVRHDRLKRTNIIKKPRAKRPKTEDGKVILSTTPEAIRARNNRRKTK